MNSLQKQNIRDGKLRGRIQRGEQPDPADFPPNHSWCSYCRSVKPSGEFHREKNGYMGHSRRCKICVAKHDRERRSTPRYKAQVYLDNARRRGLICHYSPDQLLDLFGDSPCTYCGAPIDGIGIDRIDNAKGYVEGNMVSCCFTCNGMKSRLSLEVFLKQCSAVSANAAIACGGK